MTNTFDPVEIDPHDRPLLEKIGRLRVLAWSTVIPDAASRCDCWLDDFELAARHWVIFCDGEPVAAARMSVHNRLEDVPDGAIYEGVFPEPLTPPIASINRLVTHPDFRGRGFSRKLDGVRIQAAKGDGVVGIVGGTHGDDVRLSQLAEVGFSVVGTARDYPQGHFLPKSGVVVFCDLGGSLRSAAARPGVRPTVNGMGWTSEILNEISAAFVRYAAGWRCPVLDIGAAYGVATIPSLEQGASVVANDLSAAHLAELQNRTPAEFAARLTTVVGRFPNELGFPNEAFAAVHASQVFHYLTEDEIDSGLAAIFRWLRPGGRLYVLAATPYQATHAGFIPVFSERKARGNPWPGVIEDMRGYNTHWSADLMPPWLHVFDDEVLSAAAVRAGFEVLEARMFSRAGLPDFCRLDGRENLGLIAAKPQA